MADRSQRQADRAERGAEEQYGVAHPQQVRVLHKFRVEKDEQNDKQQAVNHVVDVLRGGRLRVREAQVGQHRGEYDEQRYNGRYRRVLQLEYVALVQRFQFVVLETVPVQQSGKRDLAVRVHRFHAVIHDGTSSICLLRKFRVVYFNFTMTSL